MMIEQTKTKSFRIANAPGLDPINVVLRDIGYGVGELIVTCYGLAWTAYWGAMGEPSVEEFVRSVSADYVANRMWIPHERRVKNRYAYLVRIIEVVQAALKMPSDQSPIDPAEVSGAERGPFTSYILEDRGTAYLVREKPNSDGIDYKDPFVQEAWEAWCARARIGAALTPHDAAALVTNDSDLFVKEAREAWCSRDRTAAQVNLDSDNQASIEEQARRVE